MSESIGETFVVPGYKIIDNELPLASAFPECKVRQVTAMDLEPSDVIVASYPKTGTTVLQEIVWLIRNNGNTDLANQTVTDERIPFMEYGPLNSFEVFAELQRPRHMKTHLPYKYLPKSARDGTNKIVYVIRNPKDCLVSYYHFYKMNSNLGNFKGSWNDFFKYFMQNDAMLIFGNPFDHFVSYWEHRSDDNVFILFYEDIVMHPHETVTKIAKFLEYPLDDHVVQKIVTATSFDTMKNNPMTNMATVPVFNNEISPFIRKGKVGNWKEFFTEEQSKTIDDMVHNKLQDFDINFIYD